MGQSNLLRMAIADDFWPQASKRCRPEKD
jgi:hypothetical protein